MPTHIHTDDDLDSGICRLIKSDPRWESVLSKAGRPALRRRDGGFAGLCAIVVSQQLSTASARAIWGRVSGHFDPFHHDGIRRARTATLARLGLSAPKIRTLKALGTAVARGDIDLDALVNLPADEAHASLTALHGIGPWTADIYLLFCLGHADAWPAGDLALQESARIAFGLKRRPAAKEMVALAEPWRPWRGVAAYLLWAHYHAVKKRDPIPVQPKKTNGGAADGR